MLRVAPGSSGCISRSRIWAVARWSGIGPSTTRLTAPLATTQACAGTRGPTPPAVGARCRTPATASTQLPGPAMVAARLRPATSSSCTELESGDFAFVPNSSGVALGRLAQLDGLEHLHSTQQQQGDRDCPEQHHAEDQVDNPDSCPGDLDQEGWRLGMLTVAHLHKWDEKAAGADADQCVGGHALFQTLATALIVF